MMKPSLLTRECKAMHSLLSAILPFAEAGNFRKSLDIILGADLLAEALYSERSSPSNVRSWIGRFRCDILKCRSQASGSRALWALKEQLEAFQAVAITARRLEFLEGLRIAEELPKASNTSSEISLRSQQ
jgi:hypothetical protein